VRVVALSCTDTTGTKVPSPQTQEILDTKLGTRNLNPATGATVELEGTAGGGGEEEEAAEWERSRQLAHSLLALIS